jgi:hypothetical protein
MWQQFLFKKYLKFEKSLGEDNERIQHVQQLAMNYVQSALPSESDHWTWAVGDAVSELLIIGADMQVHNFARDRNKTWY